MILRIKDAGQEAAPLFVTEAVMNKQLALIRDYQKKPALRYKDRVFVVEGIRAYREIPKERIRTTYVSASFAGANEVPEGAVIVDDRDFERISDTKTPQGILALVKMENTDPEEIIRTDKGLILLLEDLQDPGNLGTMVRTAEACSVSGIIMNRNCVDIYNPKVVRATMGSLFRVKTAVTDDLPAVVKAIQNSGGAVYAASLEDSVLYDSPDYTKKTAFLIGNEGNGLSKEICDLSDTRIHIPMGGKVESLNAGIAAAVLLFEAARQRRKEG